MSEAARSADSNDLEALTRIAGAIRDDIREARGGMLLLLREAANEPARIRAAIAEGRALVGTIDDVVLGYAVFTVEVLSDGSKLGRLESFVVESEARGAGVGEALMNLAIDVLRAQGCQSIDSVALPGDRETKNFFESFGLKARLLVVNRRLDTED